MKNFYLFPSLKVGPIALFPKPKFLFYPLHLFLLLLCFSLSTFGQSQIVIKGQVVSCKTGKPIEFATVFIKDQAVGVVTNDLGEFTFHIPEKFKLYRAKVKLMDKGGPIKGSFLLLKDSSIVLGNKYTKREFRAGQFETFVVQVKSIKRIKIRRMGKQGKSMAIGFGAGALIGGIIGYTSGDWDSEPWGHPDSQAYAIGGLLGFVGAGIGFFVGIPSEYYRLDGNHETYTILRKQLNEYAIIKE